MSLLLRYQEKIPEENQLSIHCGTTTKTGTREESDQDQSANYSCGTKTFTEAKEEPDQDVSNRRFYLIPR